MFNFLFLSQFLKNATFVVKVWGFNKIPSVKIPSGRPICTWRNQQKNPAQKPFQIKLRELFGPQRQSKTQNMYYCSTVYFQNTFVYNFLISLILRVDI